MDPFHRQECMKPLPVRLQNYLPSSVLSLLPHQLMMGLCWPPVGYVLATAKVGPGQPGHFFELGLTYENHSP